MKEGTQRRLSELILEELSEKIRRDEHLREKLEPFVDYPVENVADTILKQFTEFLSPEMNELILHIIEKELPLEPSTHVMEEEESERLDHKEEPSIEFSDVAKSMMEGRLKEGVAASSSIMKHFGTKEPFPSEAMQIQLKPDDWLYIYGFSYAPDSTGKGLPTRMLSLSGIDKTNNIFLLDFGDIRLYMNRLNTENYTQDKVGKPTVTSHQIPHFKFEHEKILNTLRSEEVLVALPFWTVLQGREYVIKVIEERYVDMLRGLIDVHDAVEWNVDVLVFDHHILQLPSISEPARTRSAHREHKHPSVSRRDDALTEKVIFREKSIAQEIHNQLLITAAKFKVDYMIRLDTAFVDDWKSILSVRYTVNKDKRKSFWKAICSLQNDYKEFEPIIRVTNPSVHFTL